MWKSKVWNLTLVSTILRRRTTLLSISHFQSNSTSHFLSPSFSTISRTSNFDFLGNPNFPGKTFCSESAEKSHVHVRCWSCGNVANGSLFLFCDSCRSIQPLDQSVDYFQIFGLERKYDIGVENLEGKYKDWQKKLHPDLVHSKSEKERGFAAEQSARVIDAYRTLSKPLLRAIYIILEIREAVEEAADSQELHQIQSQMQEKLDHWSKSFSNAFQCRKFEEALNSIRRMTYYQRVNEEIVKKL
nr:iron-sulfur cluster co-chaperone protein hscb, mitochondrial [Quercus suber]